MKRSTIFALSAGVLVGSIGFFTADLYRYIFCRKQGILCMALLDKKTHGPDYYKARDAKAADFAKLVPAEYDILSPNGYRLKGYYYRCGEKPCGKIAFLVHGFHSNHIENAGLLYEYYLSRGFDLFCPDNTATGESGGNIFGYGYLESIDCLAWIDYLKARFGEDISLVLHGFSLGGGTVLMMSDRVPENVRFIIDDCGIDGTDSVIRPSTGDFLYKVLRRVNLVFGKYDLKDTDVRPHLARSRVPILFVHGTEDPTVPYEIGRNLYDNYEGEKDCLFVSGAKHVECFYAAGEEYAEKIDRFVEKHL